MIFSVYSMCMTRPGKKSMAKAGIEPRSVAVETGALATRPARRHEPRSVAVETDALATRPNRRPAPRIERSKCRLH